MSRVRVLAIIVVVVIAVTAVYYAVFLRPEEAVRKRLNQLKYESPFEEALIAFQKVNGLTKDGKIRDEVIEALNNPVIPRANQGHEGIHCEADLARQVMTVYRDGEIVRILPISSGSDKRFKEPGGGYSVAKTPVGSFKFFRHIGKIHKGHLGKIWYPVYFHPGGYAVHGYPEVPPYPASHGCLRIPIKDSKWFEKTVPIGSTILISETPLDVIEPK
ncbi:MAG: L,D-transpeptidase family protein [Thermodesulfobacteriota bacterium]